LPHCEGKDKRHVAVNPIAIAGPAFDYGRRNDANGSMSPRPACGRVMHIDLGAVNLTTEASR